MRIFYYVQIWCKDRFPLTPRTGELLEALPAQARTFFSERILCLSVAKYKRTWPNWEPSSKQKVQPKRPFHWVRLRAIALAGRSKTQHNNFALRVFGPDGVCNCIPFSYKVWILFNMGRRIVAILGLTRPSHIPSNNKFLKSIRMFGGKLELQSCTGHKHWPKWQQHNS